VSENAAVVMTTVADVEQANAIASGLLERRLAACVQEIAISSTYRWEGKVRREPEILLLIKTVAVRAPETIAYLEGEHPYDVPEVLALEASGGAGPYLEWVASETGDADAHQ
jgi:periplasmic divalent cation tolerance protein